MKNIIYALCEPNTETIRYIGKSSTGLKRIKDHLKMSEYTKNTHKSKWIYSLIKKGQTPTVIVIVAFAVILNNNANKNIKTPRP